jgi:predicted nucleic acid-binding protein
VSSPFVDADVIIRSVTGDDPTKQAAARALFDRVEAGELEVATPVTTIADAVYVLASPRLYALPRMEVSAILSTLVRLPNLRLPHKSAVLRALELFGATRLDFGDVLIVASMEQVGSTVVYAYDRGFDRLPALERREP